MNSHNKILKQWPQSATIYLLSRNTANFDRMNTDTLLQISSSEIHIPFVPLPIPCPKTPSSCSTRGTRLFLWNYASFWCTRALNNA